MAISRAELFSRTTAPSPAAVPSRSSDPWKIGAVPPQQLRPGMRVRYWPVMEFQGMRPAPVEAEVQSPARECGVGVWVVRLRGYGDCEVEFVAPLPQAGEACKEPR